MYNIIDFILFYFDLLYHWCTLLSGIDAHIRTSWAATSIPALMGKGGHVDTHQADRLGQSKHQGLAQLLVKFRHRTDTGQRQQGDHVDIAPLRKFSEAGEGMQSPLFDDAIRLGLIGRTDTPPPCWPSFSQAC